MFEPLTARLREATRLTGAGRLVEATNTIQRILTSQPGMVPPSTARDGQHPPTIDGVAEETGPPGTEAADHSAAVVRGFLGKVPLKDLVRAKFGPAPTVDVPVKAQFWRLRSPTRPEAGPTNFMCPVGTARMSRCH